MSDGPYRFGSIQQLTSSLALQTGMSDADTKKLRDALAAKDAEIERLRAENERLRKLDSESATHVESVICLRTEFTGDPPYVGWKGLGLALTEALNERDRLRARIAEKDEALEWVEQKPAIPLEEGWYLVMHPGDSESVDGYTLYSFRDYEGWAYWTPASPDEFEDLDGGYKGCWTCQHDEDGEFIFAYLGPFKFTPFDQRARKALEG